MGYDTKYTFEYTNDDGATVTKTINELNLSRICGQFYTFLIDSGFMPCQIEKHLRDSVEAMNNQPNDDYRIAEVLYPDCD